MYFYFSKDPQLSGRERSMKDSGLVQWKLIFPFSAVSACLVVVVPYLFIITQSP